MSLSIAYIGFGNSVVNYHLPYLEAQPNIKVKSIFRRAEDRLGDTEREKYYPSIQFTSDLQDILNDAEIELIVVCTHVDSHVYYAKLALEHNKHVLVEKPFAASCEEARGIFDLAARSGLIAMAYQNRRFDGDFLTLKKVLNSGKLGRIVEIQSHYSYFRPQSIRPGFGLLVGLAVHTIDQLVSLYGKANRVHYDVRSIYYPGESDDYIDIDFHHGILKATVKSSLSVKAQPPKFIVHGDRGSFIKYSSGHQKKSQDGPTRVSYEREPMDNWGKLFYIDEDGAEHHELVPSEVTNYGRLYEELYQCIRFNKAKPVQDEEVLYVLSVLNGGITAAKEAKLYN